jgi:uncharacterized membrane protein
MRENETKFSKPEQAGMRQGNAERTEAADVHAGQISGSRAGAVRGAAVSGRTEHSRILSLTQAAMIAAIYVVLTYVFSAFSFGQVQIRVAEALTILPVFTPAAIPGLFVGCLIGNIAGGAVLPDIIFGSIATLIGAVGTRLLRRRNPVICTLPPIVSNTVIVPFVLRFAYGVNLPIPLMMLTVGIGEVVGCGVFGVLLYSVLKRYKEVIFKTSRFESTANAAK